jgi:hypothetical protein
MNLGEIAASTIVNRSGRMPKRAAEAGPTTKHMRGKHPQEGAVIAALKERGKTEGRKVSRKT